jgi:hypothetical protein
MYPFAVHLFLLVYVSIIDESRGTSCLLQLSTLPPPWISRQKEVCFVFYPRFKHQFFYQNRL